MTTGLSTLVGIGFLLGFRHAFEPDHLAAVTTLAARQGTMRDAARLGLAWGLGHTSSVGAVALALIAAGWRMPDALQPLGDLVVAALLIGLGGVVLARYARAHRRGLGVAHAHAHAHHHAHGHVPPARGARQSFGFGIAHGLAGSGAIVVLMVAAAASRGAQLGYLGAFGAGTIVGMLGVSTAVAAATRAAGRRGRWTTWLQLGTAAASVVVGIMLGAECLAWY